MIDIKTDSSGSLIVEKILTERGISFRKEIPLVNGVGGGMLRADFAIYGTHDHPLAIIEFDGKQHRYGKTDKLEISLANDAIKTNFCNEHGIEILRVHDPDYGDYLDTESVFDFLDKLLQKHPSIKRNENSENLIKRSLNLNVVDLSELHFEYYSVQEISNLINRTPAHIWNRYIIGFGLLQNKSNKSQINTLKNSRIHKSDLILFLLEQEVLYLNNERLTSFSPAIIFEVGDLNSRLHTLVLTTNLKNVGDVLQQHKSLNLGELEILEIGIDEDEQFQQMYDILRKLSAGKYANLILSQNISKDLLREIELVSNRQFIRLYK